MARKVYNKERMGDIGRSNQSDMQSQMDSMQSTMESYESQASTLDSEASSLDSQASAQETISQTATKTITEIGPNGVPRKKVVPDEAKRAAAAAKAKKMRSSAASKRKQSSSLKSRAKSLRTSISGLAAKMVSTGAAMIGLSVATQSADKKGKKKMSNVNEKTKNYNKKMEGFKNSFNANLPLQNSSISGKGRIDKNRLKNNSVSNGSNDISYITKPQKDSERYISGNVSIPSNSYQSQITDNAIREYMSNTNSEKERCFYIITHPELFGHIQVKQAESILQSRYYYGNNKINMERDMYIYTILNKNKFTTSQVAQALAGLRKFENTLYYQGMEQNHSIEDIYKHGIDIAKEITRQFEGANYSGVTGNFDNMGMSFGIAQYNLGSNDLQPLLKDFIAQYPDLAIDIFGQDKLNQINTMLSMEKIEDQIRWSLGIQTDNKINSDWKKVFNDLGNTSQMQELQIQHLDQYEKQALSMAERYNITSTKGIVLLFDIAIQNWGIKEEQQFPIDQLVANGASEEEVLRALVDAVIDKAKWKEDVTARKETILNGKGIVHGTEYDFSDLY